MSENNYTTKIINNRKTESDELELIPPFVIQSDNKNYLVSKSSNGVSFKTIILSNNENYKTGTLLDCAIFTEQQIKEFINNGTWKLMKSQLIIEE